VLCGYSMADVMAEQTYRAGRVKVYFLSQVAAPRHQSVVPDDTINNIVNALSTSWRSRPSEIAAWRIDWAALSATLPLRMRKILHWLSIGFTKTQISKKLNVTQGRVTQLLEALGRDIIGFFGAENLLAH